MGFQIKVISSLLTNKDLLLNVRDSINPDDFDNDSHKWIVEFIMKYFDKYHTIPDMSTLHIEVKKVDNEIIRIGIIEQLREAYKASEDDLRYVEEEFTRFCTNQQIKKALFTSVDLLKLGDFEGIKQLITRALKYDQNKNVGHIYEKDVETRYREDDRSPIPYPWEAFNDITQGGYGKGELVLLFGNPKGGKSWVAIAMAAYAVSLGYNIVYYTLELSEGYVGKRFDAVFTGFAVDKCKDHRQDIDRMVGELKGKLRIKEFSAGRASLDNIESHLQQLENQDDFKPDAIFIDYLDLLKNRNKNRAEKRDDLDDIYTDARGMGRERRVPIISPSQVNRAGANDNVIQADKVAGSYGKMMIGDFVVSLSRKRKDKLAGIGRFHIMGNRLGIDGVTYIAKIDTSRGYIDIDNNPIDIEDDEEDDKYKKKSSSNDLFNSDEKKMLRKKFIEDPQ